jgi:uncharacterized RDD family membrane protein YckC
MPGDDLPGGFNVCERDCQTALPHRGFPARPGLLNLQCLPEAYPRTEAAANRTARCDVMPLATESAIVHFDEDRARQRIMAASEPKRIGVSIELKPHAYDPSANPELFEGVLARRVLAFVIDFVILAVPVLFAAMFIFVIGLLTLGLGFFIYALLWPAMVIWAVTYYGLTLGGPRSATIGMRVMDLEMRTWYGAPSYFLLGAVHAVVFWITVSALTPLVLLVCLVNERRRCLHDILVGTIVINNAARSGDLRGARQPT